MTKISPEGHRIKEGATYSSSNSGGKVKITNEQAQRLFALVQKIVRKGFLDNGSVRLVADEIYALGDMVGEIERANQPPEIRWCVRHQAVGFGGNCCCAKNSCDMPRTEGCEIWTYAPKGKE